SDVGRDGPGFDVRVIGGDALVVKVDEEAPAAQLGIRPGWQVVKIHDADLASILAELKDAKRPEVDQAVAVLGRLRGRAGQKKTMVFRNGDAEDVTLDVPFITPKG